MWVRGGVIWLLGSEGGGFVVRTGVS